MNMQEWLIAERLGELTVIVPLYFVFRLILEIGKGREKKGAGLVLHVGTCLLMAVVIMWFSWHLKMVQSERLDQIEAKMDVSR